MMLPYLYGGTRCCNQRGKFEFRRSKEPARGRYFKCCRPVQAGLGGMQSWGGSSDEMVFVENGLTMHDERYTKPYTGLSLTAIKEVQVQAGGFSAEFGNVCFVLVKNKTYNA